MLKRLRTIDRTVLERLMAMLGTVVSIVAIVGTGSPALRFAFIVIFFVLLGYFCVLTYLDSIGNFIFRPSEVPMTQG